MADTIFQSMKMRTIFLLAISALAVQAAELSQKLPEALRQVRDHLETYPWGRFLLEKAPLAAESLAQAGDFSRVTGLVSGVANFLVAGVVILFVGIFGAAEPHVYKMGLLYLVPPARRRRVAQVVDAVALDLRGWLLGQVILMVMMGATTALGLWLVGVPQALTLGIIAGILELIPYIGAWLSAVPAALIALLLGPWYLAMTLALYLGLHILEGYILVPLVQRRAVHLPPALTLVAQLLLGDLLGGLGLFVAVGVTRYWIWRRMTLAEATLFLQDVQWQETRGEQRRLNRWLAWARLRQGRREESGRSEP